MPKKADFIAINAVAVVLAALLQLGTAGSASAQSRTGTVNGKADERGYIKTGASESDAADPYFKEIYRTFYETYKLGPEDELAIRVVGQPDYSIEKAQVNPFGRIFHPLIGEIDVAGLTVRQATDKITTDLSEYIINPRVSLSLLTANSAKVGVLGEVTRPGILIMAKPMTLLDAISGVGGVTDYGSQTKITLLRQMGEGRMRTTTVNLKHVLEAKGGAEENVVLQAGDTVIVHGNFRKTFETITRLVGFGYFVKILAGA